MREALVRGGTTSGSGAEDNAKGADCSVNSDALRLTVPGLTETGPQGREDGKTRRPACQRPAAGYCARAWRHESPGSLKRSRDGSVESTEREPVAARRLQHRRRLNIDPFARELSLRRIPWEEDHDPEAHRVARGRHRQPRAAVRGADLGFFADALGPDHDSRQLELDV